MRITIGLVVLLAICAATGAAAQERTDTVPGASLEEMREMIESVGPRVGSIAAEAAPELEDALERLSATLGVLAGRIATDPELRASAFRAAEGMIGLAQIVVAEQSDAIVEALRAAADRIAAVPTPADGAAGGTPP